MADQPKVEKATISSLDRKKRVVCHFNPSAFDITRKIKWEDVETLGDDTPKKVFTGGQANDLTVTLLFDTTDTGDDVRNSFRTLLELAQIDQSKKNTKTGKGEPPQCTFQWGKFLSFTAVITEIAQSFKMFKLDGTPVRAEITVSFSQVQEKAKRQNPTSRSEPRKIWVVREGERLDWIAYQEYGDPAYWRHIAETNDLDNPDALRPGQVLKLVPLS